MSSRMRLYVVVAAAALGAAAIAVGVAWTGRGADEESPVASGEPLEGSPPLALDVLVEDVGEAEELQAAVGLYTQGELERAAEAFDAFLAEHPDSLYAAVGAALASWPDGTIAELRRLQEEHPESALVELHLGLGLYWEGRNADAEAVWKEALADDPDSPAAIRAESLLHPEMPAGRPFFVPSKAAPEELVDLPPLQQLAELERLAEEQDDAAAWIQYGTALQRAGRPVSATAAFDRAAARDPEDPEALTAAALARFTKDDPSLAFSRLGPLSSEFPDEPVVRFHLGLALLWLRNVDEARAHLEAAAAAGEESVYGRQARELLDRLGEAADGS